MTEPAFDPLEFLSYLRTRWWLVAASCGTALVLTFAVSLLLPKRFTATAQILIQPPGGNDPRAATAITPVYLDSLKAWERMASSDLLFVRALDRVHMSPSAAGGSVESLKRRVLRVVKPANTAMLEISATMTDPGKAQALAQSIAEQTVEVSRSNDSRSAADNSREFQTQFSQAQTRLAAARAALAAPANGEDADALESQIENNAEVKTEIEKDLALARTELAGDLAQTAGQDQSTVASERARIASLENQRQDLIGTLDKQSARLAALKNRKLALESEAKAAQTAFETANARLNEANSSGAFRGERLTLIDPGIVPQEPSSPHIVLNLLAGLMIAAVGSFTWLAIAFGTRGRANGLTESPRVVRSASISRR